MERVPSKGPSHEYRRKSTEQEIRTWRTHRSCPLGVLYTGFSLESAALLGMAEISAPLVRSEDRRTGPYRSIGARFPSLESRDRRLVLRWLRRPALQPRTAQDRGACHDLTTRSSLRWHAQIPRGIHAARSCKDRDRGRSLGLRRLIYRAGSECRGEGSGRSARRGDAQCP